MQVKQLFLYLLSGFFFIAGINHFINPDFYLPLIPKYLGYPEFINYSSGLVEVLLSIGLLLNSTRKITAYLIIGLLIVFIPSHVYFIAIGSCVPQWFMCSRMGSLVAIACYSSAVDVVGLVCEGL